MVLAASRYSFLHVAGRVGLMIPSSCSGSSGRDRELPVSMLPLLSIVPLVTRRRGSLTVVVAYLVMSWGRFVHIEETKVFRLVLGDSCSLGLANNPWCIRDSVAGEDGTANGSCCRFGSCVSNAQHLVPSRADLEVSLTSPIGPVMVATAPSYKEPSLLASGAAALVLAHSSGV
jgi:hypothetical protein